MLKKKISLHHIPKVFFWIEICWLEAFEYSKLIIMVKKQKKQLEIIWALSHGTLSCWKQPSEDDYTVVIKKKKKKDCEAVYTKLSSFGESVEVVASVSWS